MTEHTEKQRYYYDACTLDLTETYQEITNSKHCEAVVSFLALGEAYGNTLLYKSEDQLDSFLKFISNLNKASLIFIVGNDDVDHIADEIKASKTGREMSTTDAIHFATAVREKCSVFRTSDRDFHGCTGKEFAEVAQKYGAYGFSIQKIDLPKKSKYGQKIARRLRK